MLQELKTLFAQQAEQELLQTMREFHSCNHEEGQSVSSYILKMMSYIDNLERLGHPMSLGLGVSKVQKGNNKHKKQQPQLAAKGQNQGNGKNKLAYAPKPKIPPPPKKEDPVKDSSTDWIDVFVLNGGAVDWKSFCAREKHFRYFILQKLMYIVAF
ncbi:hypothetical protein Tco_0595219 [Tanacetum coccineum]